LSACLITEILIDSGKIPSLSVDQWDLLVRQARASNLMGRLYIILLESDYLYKLPENIRNHFISENKYFEAQKSSVIWEIENIRKALQYIDVPVVLLKGAAYLKSELKLGHGRIFNDIDILVPRESIEKVEDALKKQGWLTTHLDDYDQKYYRKWMHEIPPLKHVQRKTVLDVHHNILPETSTGSPDCKKLIDASIALDETGNLRVLSKVDMFIHSATHLFHEGEFSHGLRDLHDLALLIDECACDSFWQDLFDRAKELDLVWPVQYSLIYIKKILKRDIPEGIALLQDDKTQNGFKARFIYELFLHAFRSGHCSCENRLTPVALWLLYMRGHWLRMPVYLLIPHLLQKAFKKDKNHKTL